MFDADGRPLHVYWGYDRAELIADAVVHVVGLALAVAGAIAIVVLAALHASASETTAVVVYAACLLALLGFSAAYNMWPISPTKWWLRRFDHACIFLLIAATYTPFLSRFPGTPASIALFVGVWATALAGAALKLTMPGRFDRVTIVLYIALGFSGGLAWDMVSVSLSPTTIALIIAGGLTYVFGVIFHVWESMRFQNAVWHGFVLVASVIFYIAVLHGVVLA